MAHKGLSHTIAHNWLASPHTLTHGLHSILVYTHNIRASTSVDANLSFILHKKTTFSILHKHFYKTHTSVHLLYTIFYKNNIFIFFFLILFYLSFLFPYLSAVSSFFFFLFFLLLSLTVRSTSPSKPKMPLQSTDLRQHSITSTTTIKTQKHRSTSLIHMQRQRWRR